jgi:hypothetical protein
MFGKVHVGKPKNENEESLIANWPIDELQVRMAAVIHVQKGEGQEFTLVHISAQPKPFWSHLSVSPCLID